MQRCFDIIVSCLALLVLWPWLLLIAICVRLDSSGPALFRQRRVGRHGDDFTILKYRTMVPRAEQHGPRVTAEGDARVTGLGGFLRRLKLDELPQLWNILVGDMAFVGPRPEVREYMDKVQPEARTVILAVRPGLTDPGYLEFHNEAEILAEHDDPERAYIEHVLPRKTALQAAYVKRRTLRSDISVLLRTLWRIVRVH